MRFRARSHATLTAVVLLGASEARAQVTQLTFEGLGDNEVIGNYYNGGPGGSLGVTFGTTAQAIISEAAGGSGNFQSPPSGVTTMYFPTVANAYMDVAGGFSTGFSLFYSAIVYPAMVSVYSGFGGTGTLLGTLDLALTPSQPGTPGCPDPTLQYCPWVAASVPFAGLAHSIVFSGTANYVGFDNITFGSTNPNTAPEPATWALLGVGLAGLAGAAARRRRRDAAG